MMNNHPGSQAPGKSSGFFYGYIIVIAAFITQITMVGPRMSFGVFIKPLINEFGWSRALTSSAASFSSVAQGFAGIGVGNLNDRLGPRIVMTICTLIIGAGYILMSTTNTVWQLYAFYVVMVGIGMGASFVPAMSTVSRWFTKRRSAMIGITIGGGGIGGAILPPVLDWLISDYGWRNTYIILGITFLVITLLASQFLVKDPAMKGLVPYGDKSEEKKELNSFISDGSTMKEAIYTWQFWTAIVMLFCFGFCVYTTAVHIVPHITDMGISSTTAANILAVTGVAVIIGGLTMGYLGDKIGNKLSYIICFILIVIGAAWLVTASDIWVLYLCSLMIGFSGGGCTALEAPLTAELFGTKEHGFILGALSFGHLTGMAIGPYLGGLIFDITGNYRLAFIIIASLALLAILLSAIIKPTKTAIQL